MRENTAEQVRHKPEMMAECERDPESRVCGSVGVGGCGISSTIHSDPEGGGTKGASSLVKGGTERTFFIKDKFKDVVG